MKRFLPPLVLLLITTLFSILFYQSAPGVSFDADSITYLAAVLRINHSNPFSLTSLVGPVRLPGYPLFIILAHSLQIATYLQIILFISVTMMSYWIALLVFKKAWISSIIGLLIGTNPALISYFKPIMSEPLACFLLTLSALLCTLYIRSPHLLSLTSLILALFYLIFTRPEWLILPPLLFPLLLIATTKRRSLLQHSMVMLIGIICIYGCIFLYIEINGKQNDMLTLSAISNMNLYGKILQYHMEDETPPSSQANQVIACIKETNSRNPYHLMPCTKTLAEPYAAPAGNYAWSIIKKHPLEFIQKTIPLCFSSLISYFDPKQKQPFLQILQLIHQVLYKANILLALFPLPLFLLLARKAQLPSSLWTLIIFWLTIVIADITTSLAGYSDVDYARFHSVFEPLAVICLWGGFLFLADLLIKRWKMRTSFIYPCPQCQFSIKRGTALWTCTQSHPERLSWSEIAIIAAILSLPLCILITEKKRLENK